MAPSLCPIFQSLYLYVEPLFLPIQTLGGHVFGLIQKIQEFAHLFFTQLEKFNSFSLLQVGGDSIKGTAIVLCVCLVTFLVVSIVWACVNRKGIFSPSTTPATTPVKSHPPRDRKVSKVMQKI